MVTILSSVLKVTCLALAHSADVAGLVVIGPYRLPPVTVMPKYPLDTHYVADRDLAIQRRVGEISCRSGPGGAALRTATGGEHGG